MAPAGYYHLVWGPSDFGVPRPSSPLPWASCAAPSSGQEHRVCSLGSGPLLLWKCHCHTPTPPAAPPKPHSSAPPKDNPELKRMMPVPGDAGPGVVLAHHFLALA